MHMRFAEVPPERVMSDFKASAAVVGSDGRTMAAHDGSANLNIFRRPFQYVVAGQGAALSVLKSAVSMARGFRCTVAALNSDDDLSLA
jgi:hypothetical protein